MVKIATMTLVILWVIYFLMTNLIKQSGHPAGIVGNWMMSIWNSVYLPMVKWSLDLIPLKLYPKILDVGIGNGASTAYIHQRFSSSHIDGIDISQDAIKMAYHLNSDCHITFQVADVRQLSYADKNFDLICAFQTHFHWSNLTESLLEINRVLADDGVFIIVCEWNKVSYYLPQFKKESVFKLYLEQIGLQLLETEKQRGWIYYRISKNE